MTDLDKKRKTISDEILGLEKSLVSCKNDETKALIKDKISFMKNELDKTYEAHVEVKTQVDAPCVSDSKKDIMNLIESENGTIHVVL